VVEAGNITKGLHAGLVRASGGLGVKERGDSWMVRGSRMGVNEAGLSGLLAYVYRKK